MKLFALIFPYRTHLEAEVDYLRGQLSQKQRRIDEMQDAINKVALRAAEPKLARVVPPVPVIVPKGWDAYRASKRGETSDQEEAPQPETAAIQTSV